MQDLLSFAPLLAFAVFVVLDFVVPARAFPHIRYWRLRGLAFFVLNLALFSTLPFLWDETLGEHRIIDATGLGTAGGAIAGLLVAQLVQYVWHRSLHRVPLLFRWVHQMHHSSERMDIWSAMYFSPLDVLGFAFVGSFSLVMVLGVTPEAALVASSVSTFAALFTHSNLRTPRWLGYIIQRPENHALHHERGVHAYNYADFPIWDLVFGTFRNPERWEGKAGYYDGASSRVVDMLIGRDVTESAQPRPSRPDLAGSRPMAA